jgi:hypothetical protein
MYYSRYALEQLKLEASDLESLSDDEQRQKLRLHWMGLCLNAESIRHARDYTYYYQQCTSYAQDNQAIQLVYDAQYVDVPHTAFDLLQREQIEALHHDVLHEFSQLPTALEKQNFARQHAAFLNLAGSLRNNQKSFDKILGPHLYQKQHEAWCDRIVYQWRLHMIRLFGIEGVDDAHYRYALTTGELGPILARDKLCSPLKLVVALLNSIMLVITAILDYILKLHPSLRVIFFFLQSHPVGMILARLPMIARMLEMIACPTNQIIRPLCAYTHASPLCITSLLVSASLVALYGMLYTTLLAQLVTLLPYLALIAMSYFLYSIGKQCVAFFRKSFVEGMAFTSALVIMCGLRAYIGHGLNSGQSHAEQALMQQCLSVFSLFSMGMMLGPGSNQSNASLGILPLYADAVPASQLMHEIEHVACCKANLSHRFFNTPQDARPIRKSDVEQGCYALSIA